MSMIYSVFHMSMLRKFVGDLSSELPLEDVSVDENLTYKEVPVEIMYHK